MIQEESCPVPERLLGELYRANAHGLDALVATVPPSVRAMLALYCFRRGHLNSIGLAVAASCEEYDLIEAGGRAGQALYEMARERPETPRSEPTGRKTITKKPRRKWLRNLLKNRLSIPRRQQSPSRQVRRLLRKQKPLNGALLERLLLVATFLARVFRARNALLDRNAIGCAALSALRLDPRIALLHDEGFTFHRLANETLGLRAHRIFVHPHIPETIKTQSSLQHLCSAA